MIDSVQLAKKVRIDILKMINKSHASHIASAYSIVDILSVLYNDILDTNDFDFVNTDRNKIIMSKGHAGSAIYAVLYEKGIITKNEIDNYYTNGGNLSGHISHKNVKGVEFSTGSLGHGCCVASGMALAKKINNAKGKVYAIVGDGECNEGSVWEMAMFAVQQKLDNFVVIIDNNKMQAMGYCKDIINLPNLAKIWEDFGWCVKTIDGHNHREIKAALSTSCIDKPLCIIANTIKGKGVSFMENNILWHYRDPQNELFDQALKELNQ